MKRSKYEPGDFQLEIKRSKAGLGLFASERIPKGACIIEYVGHVIPEEEARVSRNKYLFEVAKNVTIDGSSRSNKARYINHSCRPNCEIEIRKRRVFVMARRAIRAGEELSYDYGEEYFDDYIRPKGCKCEPCST